jgi:hypothetical protein
MDRIFAGACSPFDVKPLVVSQEAALFSDSDICLFRVGPARASCPHCGTQREAEEHFYKRVPLHGVGQSHALVAGTDLKADELIRLARVALANLVSEYLRDEVNVVLFDDGEEALLRHVPKSLSSVIYLQLALRSAGVSSPERPCEHCRVPFFAARRDQRFCRKECRELAGYYRRRAKLA